MPMIIVRQAFTYWHRGFERRDYQPGQHPVDTDAECSAVAIAEGWADPADQKHQPSAPENKDAAPRRRTKAAAGEAAAPATQPTTPGAPA